MLSCSGVFAQIVSGLVSIDDLDGALFYFGCTRNHAFRPESSEFNEMRYLDRGDRERERLIHAELMEGVAHASREPELPPA